MTLVVFAPLDSDLGRRALSTCTDIIVLARPEDDVRALLPADEDRVREVIGPVGQAAQRQVSVHVPASAAPAPRSAGENGRHVGPVDAPSVGESKRAPAGVVQQIRGLFDPEQAPSVLVSGRPIRSGRDRRAGPDRRQQLWKEAANTMRHQADLPAGVRFDRRRRHRSDRRDGDERRDLSSRPKQEQPWDDAYTVAPRDLEPAPKPRRRKRRERVAAIQDSGFGRSLGARGRSERPPAGGVVGTGRMPATLGGGPIQVGSRGSSRSRDSGWVVTVAMWLIAAAVALFVWTSLS